MRVELLIAWRFLRENRTQTVLTFSGVAVGVAVIIFIAALLDAVGAGLIDKTLGSQPHIVLRNPDERPRVLTPPAGASGPVDAVRVEASPKRLRSIDQWPLLVQQAERAPGVRAVSPTIVGAGVARRGGAAASVQLHGVELSRFERIIPITRRLAAGKSSLPSDGAIIGMELAADLGITVGEKLRLEGSDGRSGICTVQGIFDLGNREVNARWVLLPLRAAQNLLDLAGGITRIELTVDEVFSAEAIAVTLASRTGLVAESWMATNRDLLIGLRSQTSSRYLIQLFVILAVALGISSVLVVAVVQKSREIGILKAMGAPTARVVRIFLLQGAAIGLGGSVLGALLGAGLSWSFGRLAVGPDGLPLFAIVFSPRLYAGAMGIAIAVGLGAAVLPARRAARLDPATVIRYG